MTSMNKPPPSCVECASEQAHRYVTITAMTDVTKQEHSFETISHYASCCWKFIFSSPDLVH